MLRADELNAPIGQPLEDVSAELVVVREHILRDWYVVIIVPRCGLDVVGVDCGLRPISDAVVVVEEFTAFGVDGGGGLPCIDQRGEIGGFRRVDIVVEETRPRLHTELTGDVDPPEWARFVVDTHRDERRQSLHHEGFARRPDDAAPHQVIEAVDRTFDRVGHPVVRSPLHGVAQSAFGNREEGLGSAHRQCCRGCRYGDPRHRHTAGADRLPAFVPCGDVVFGSGWCVCWD